jgi:hypothetical protein
MGKIKLEEALNILLRFTPKITQNTLHKEIEKIRKLLQEEDKRK